MTGIVESQRFNALFNFFFRTIFPIAQMVKNLPAMQKAQIQSLGQADLLAKGMGIHSSLLAWRTPCIEEPGGLQYVGFQRVGHN